VGASHSYRCETCGYEEEISGGADVGMRLRTRTAVCRQCRRLVDTVVCYSEGHLERDPDDAARIGCPRCGLTIAKGDLTALWD
jgi:predicted RNA-binding Zn-ribbon protein involved in translation (DUF1610 family)